MLERVSSTDSATIEPSPAPDAFPRGYYHDHIDGLPKRLVDAVPRDELRVLHVRSGWRHLLIALRQAAIGGACLWGMITYPKPWIWLPLAALQGTVILSFIILLHEVVHETVFKERRPQLASVLRFLYALPSTISGTQFTRWHLDHHKGLGSTTEDPKRAHLSPKRNARWYKALYMTFALFFIYMKASATEARTYDAALRRRIAMEKIVNFALHAALVAAIWKLFGGAAVLRAYVVPLAVFFPPAFMLNRLGQHYWIDPKDPAKWSTRVDGSPIVNFLFLNSNHHIEHHYFPRVPLYSLPALNRDLRPFWSEIGHPNRSYPALMWGWFVKNGSPHSDWTDLA